jgi:hypothetical protein
VLYALHSKVFPVITWKLRLVDTRVLSYKIENVNVAPLGKWKTNIIFCFTVINLKMGTLYQSPFGAHKSPFYRHWLKGMISCSFTSISFLTINCGFIKKTTTKNNKTNKLLCVTVCIFTWMYMNTKESIYKLVLVCATFLLFFSQLVVQRDKLKNMLM